MNLRATPVFVLLAILAIGCKQPAPPSFSIVGDWTNDEPNMRSGWVSFKEDGTATMTRSQLGPDSHSVYVIATATYKVTGDQLALHPIDMKMVAPKGASERDQKMVENANKVAPAEKGQESVAVIKWRDKDNFTLTNIAGGAKGSVVGFSRK